MKAGVKGKKTSAAAVKAAVKAAAKATTKGASSASAKSKAKQAQKQYVEGGREYEVEGCLGRRTVKGGSSYEYNIKWLGYPESDNTWEPAANVRHLSVIKAFDKAVDDAVRNGTVSS